MELPRVINAFPTSKIRESGCQLAVLNAFKLGILMLTAGYPPGGYRE